MHRLQQLSLQYLWGGSLLNTYIVCRDSHRDWMPNERCARKSRSVEISPLTMTPLPSAFGLPLILTNIAKNLVHLQNQKSRKIRNLDPKNRKNDRAKRSKNRDAPISDYSSKFLLKFWVFYSVHGQGFCNTLLKSDFPLQWIMAPSFLTTEEPLHSRSGRTYKMVFGLWKQGSREQPKCCKQEPEKWKKTWDHVRPMWTKIRGRARAKGVVLSEKVCFCLLCAFSTAPSLRQKCETPNLPLKDPKLLDCPNFADPTPALIIPSIRCLPRKLMTTGGLSSAPAEGQRQQLKTTSDVTCKFPWCCRASVLWSGKEALDVASDDPPDEALSCRRRAWDLVARTCCVSFALRCVSKFRPAEYSTSRVEIL